MQTLPKWRKLMQNFWVKHCSCILCIHINSHLYIFFYVCLCITFTCIKCRQKNHIHTVLFYSVSVAMFDFRWSRWFVFFLYFRFSHLHITFAPVILFCVDFSCWFYVAIRYVFFLYFILFFVLLLLFYLCVSMKVMCIFTPFTREFPHRMILVFIFIFLGVLYFTVYFNLLTGIRAKCVRTAYLLLYMYFICSFFCFFLS